MEEWLLALVEHLGYIGLFLATLVESTFVPIPAEVTMIPAGILAAQGVMNYWLILISSTLGVVAGSAINYWIGIRWGRELLFKYGRYILIKPHHIEKTEIFFNKHGNMAVFLGRLLPGIKHYISFVAGIAKMRFRPFIGYTALGGLIWMWILLQIGYMAEKNKQSGHSDVSSLKIIIISLLVLTGIVWLIKQKMMRH